MKIALGFSLKLSNFFDFTSLRQGQFLANAFFNLILKQKKTIKNEISKPTCIYKKPSVFRYTGT